jgi:hypothetical protein
MFPKKENKRNLLFFTALTQYKLSSIGFLLVWMKPTVHPLPLTVGRSFTGVDNGQRNFSSVLVYSCTQHFIFKALISSEKVKVSLAFELLSY